MTKTVLITGSTDGIGLLTAQKLAGLGHKVILHGRNEDKLAQAAKEVPGALTYCADLSKLEEVDALAERLLRDLGKIDVLINNAGVLKASAAQAASGRDIRFEVNTIAPFLLTKKLLPILPKDGRVVNLSSAAQAPVDLQAMMQFQPMADMEAYAQSKRAITVWTAELAEAFPEGPLMVSVNPGSLLATKMVKEGFGIAGNDLSIGADVLIQAALSDEFAEATGRYFDNDAGRFGPVEVDPTQASALMDALNSFA